MSAEKSSMKKINDFIKSENDKRVPEYTYVITTRAKAIIEDALKKMYQKSKNKLK